MPVLDEKPAVPALEEAVPDGIITLDDPEDRDEGRADPDEIGYGALELGGSKPGGSAGNDETAVEEVADAVVVLMVDDGVVVAFVLEALSVVDAGVDLIVVLVADVSAVVALVLEALGVVDCWLAQPPTPKSFLRASAYDPVPTLLLLEAVAS